jgi:hypothetical protein
MHMHVAHVPTNELTSIDQTCTPRTSPRTRALIGSISGPTGPLDRRFVHDLHADRRSVRVATISNDQSGFLACCVRVAHQPAIQRRFDVPLVRGLHRMGRHEPVVGRNVRHTHHTHRYAP